MPSCGSVNVASRGVSARRRLPLHARRPSFAICNATAATAPLYGELFSYLSTHGGRIHAVEVQEAKNPSGGTNRKLVATKDVDAGEVLVSVPWKACLRYSSSDCTKLQPLYNEIPRGQVTGANAWQYKMALQLIWQTMQGKASPYHQYIKTLPGVAPDVTTPLLAMFFSESALQSMQCPHTMESALRHRIWWENFCSQVLDPLAVSDLNPFGNVRVDASTMGWALSVAMSRTMYVQQLQDYAMVPVLDMANHASYPNCAVRVSPEGELQLVTQQQVPALSECLLSYGHLSNEDLVVSYGFVLHDNEWDAFEWEVDEDLLLELFYGFAASSHVEGVSGLPRCVADLAPWQRRLLVQLLGDDEESGISAGGGIMEFNGNGEFFRPSRKVRIGPAAAAANGPSGLPVDGRLLGACRVLLAQDPALVVGRSLRDICNTEKPLSVGNEVLSLRVLLGLLTALQRSLPSTLEADEELLVSAEGPAARLWPGDQRAALQLRRERKAALAGAAARLIARLKEVVAVPQS